ncbi:MAG: hypothetical protein ABIR67_08635 [Gaiellaceae bacterium]
MRFVLIALSTLVLAAASTIPAAVAAETEVNRVSDPFSTVVGDSPCTGEPVAVKGMLVLSRTGCMPLSTCRSPGLRPSSFRG